MFQVQTAVEQSLIDDFFPRNHQVKSLSGVWLLDS